jgi:hypothetical protein
MSSEELGVFVRFLRENKVRVEAGAADAFHSEGRPTATAGSSTRSLGPCTRNHGGRSSATTTAEVRQRGLNGYGSPIGHPPRDVGFENHGANGAWGTSWIVKGASLVR